MNEKWRRAGKEEREGRKEAREQELDQSVTGVLETLVKPLEAASLHGLVTVDLAGAVSRSSLLADDRLRQDRISLDCLETITRPLQLMMSSCQRQMWTMTDAIATPWYPETFYPW